MNQSQENRISRRLRIGFTVGAISLFVILLIANLDTVNHWLGMLLRMLSPLLTGLVIAYLANPFFRFFERKVFRHLNRPRLRRFLSLLLTYLVLLAIIAGLILLIIPQLVGVAHKVSDTLHQLRNDQKDQSCDDGKQYKVGEQK